jgi:gluconokinase
MNVPSLRSCYDKIGGIVYFGRMLDKIRLHAQGRLPAEYHENLGTGFDGRCCSFLHVKYEDVVARVKLGGGDEDILQ